MRIHAPSAATRTAAAIAALSLAIPLSLGPAAAERSPAPSSVEGKWTAADKQLHFAGSFAIAATLRAAGRTDAESFGGTVGIGVLKELYDATLKPRRKARGFGWKDLAADVLGAAAGIAIAGAFDR